MTRTERVVHAGPAARGLTVVVEGRSQNRRSLQNINKSQLARPCTCQENARGVLHDTPTENARVYHTWNKRVIDPIPLNAVRAAAADVAAGTSDTAVAAPVADIAGAAADIVANARAAAHADVAADTAVGAADAAADNAVVAAANTVVAADVAAAVDSAGDLYRRACRVRRHCGLHVPRSTRRFWLWS